jgi:hypothetical protein
MRRSRSSSKSAGMRSVSVVPVAEAAGVVAGGHEDDVAELGEALDPSG